MRSTGRISKEVPILLIGDDLGGTVFSERTKTVVLSLHGAGILSKHKLSPEQELILRWPDRNKEAEIRVVGQLGSHNKVHTYGVAFVDPNLNFWEMDFPPVSDLEREMGLLSLACSVCGALEKIDDTSVEADICVTNDGVMRFCKRCGVSTRWKPALAAAVASPPQQPASFANGQMALFPIEAAPLLVIPPTLASPAPSPQPPAPESFYAGTSILLPPQPAVPAAAHPSSYYAAVPEEFERSHAVLTMAPTSAAEKPAPAALTAKQPASAPTETSAAGDAPRVNRRKYPRVKVNYSACVRHPQRGDDIVLCEDMSKGGLRFKSRKPYYPQTIIEVAAPYQPGQAAIFVPGQIVYVEELPEQKLFRYGVQYLKPSKVRDTL